MPARRNTARWSRAADGTMPAHAPRPSRSTAATVAGPRSRGRGVAAIAMRQGDEPFRDICSSQGPLFRPLVHLADLAGFQTLDAPRLLAVLAGAVTTVAVYCAGRELMDRGRALLAGTLAGSSGV